MTSDIDMLPISRSYFIDNIAGIPDDKFVNLNAHSVAANPACYNVAKGSTFIEVLKLADTFEEFLKQTPQGRKQLAKINKGNKQGLFAKNMRQKAKQAVASTVDKPLLNLILSVLFPDKSVNIPGDSKGLERVKNTPGSPFHPDTPPEEQNRAYALIRSINKGGGWCACSS